MSGPPPAEDRARLADVQHVLHGPDGSGSWKSLLYGLYLVGMLTGLYGFTVLRAVVEALDLPARGWRLGPTDAAGATVLAGLVAGLGTTAVLAHLTGRRRGPVTPPVPWLDHVAAGPLDRALTLRDAWRLPATGIVAGGTLVGGVLGAAVWGGGAAGPAAGAAGLAAGLLGSSALVVGWLAGQLVADPAASTSVGAALGRSVTPRRALRSLGLEGLRAHSARSSRLGGAALAGDPRAARLEAASPVRRGRHLRLRSRGPVATVVARDVLGLRRQPLLVVGGVLLVGLGAVGLGAVSAGRPGNLVPALLVALALHLGTGLVSEGLRLLGDTLGAPRLLGGSVEQEALAHTVTPAAVLAVAGLPVAVTVAARGGGAGAATAAALGMVGVAGVALAAHWVAAFRVQPPSWAFIPEGGPVILLGWLALAPLLTGVGGMVVLTITTSTGGRATTALAPAALVVVMAWAWARGALRSAAGAHRA